MRERPVTFQVSGQQVVGMVHIPEGVGPFPVVIFLHGFTGSKVEAHRLFVGQARDLARAGIASLRFDFRGNGDSEGEFREMTMARNAEDAAAALQFVLQRDDFDPARIGVLGMSMGGMVAAFALADHPEFKAGVLWNAVAKPRARRDARLSPEAMAELGNPTVLDNGGWGVGVQFFQELGDLDPLAAICKTKASVLVVGATADEAVPFVEAEAFRATLTEAGVENALYAVQGAGHTFASLAWKAEVFRETTAWFKKWL